MQRWLSATACMLIASLRPHSNVVVVVMKHFKLGLPHGPHSAPGRRRVAPPILRKCAHLVKHCLLFVDRAVLADPVNVILLVRYVFRMEPRCTRCSSSSARDPFVSNSRTLHNGGASCCQAHVKSRLHPRFIRISTVDLGHKSFGSIFVDDGDGAPAETGACHAGAVASRLLTGDAHHQV